MALTKVNATNIIDGVLPVANGGTGATTQAGAAAAVLPSQTGQSGKYLATDGTNTSWDQINISTADITGTLPVANGGTGQTTANAGFNALAPSQTGNSGKYLTTDGTNTSWDQINISTADITGTLPVANGGTGQTTANSAFNALAPSQTSNSGKYLTTDGTNTSWGTVTAPTPAAVSDQNNTSTGYFDLPSGTTAQRPSSPTAGMIRFNTTLGYQEYYNGSAWYQVQALPYAIDYLVVAGGGGASCGGGGAGGYISGSTSVTVGSAYSITVGAGGTGTVPGSSKGNNGSNSTGFSQTAIGGGGGGGSGALGGSGPTGASGGSGGGGGTYGSNTGGAGTSGQGNAGGTGSQAIRDNSGGGGGASAVGSNATYDVSGGAGGNGTQWLNGTYYAGGGGGSQQGTSTTNPPGGNGGGGQGDNSDNNSNTAGTANTGGGGGGSDSLGKNGGSGVVIVRYEGGQRGTGGTVTSSGGYTYHTFTSSSTYTA